MAAATEERRQNTLRSLGLVAMVPRHARASCARVEAARALRRRPLLRNPIESQAPSREQAGQAGHEMKDVSFAYPDGSRVLDDYLPDHYGILVPTVGQVDAAQRDGAQTALSTLGTVRIGKSELAGQGRSTWSFLRRRTGGSSRCFLALPRAPTMWTVSLEPHAAPRLEPERT